MRRTRVSPRSGSTATSTNTAPKACIEKRWPFIARLHVGRGLDGLAEAAHGFDEVVAPPRASASSRALRQAACTALPTLAIVIEPPCTGALGSRCRRA